MIYTLPPTSARSVALKDLTRFLGGLDASTYRVTVEAIDTPAEPVPWREYPPAISMELPHPPSVNHIYNNAQGGGRYLTPKAKQFREHVGKLCLFHKSRKLTGPLSLTLDWYPPDTRTRDIDNILKATLDALEYGQLFDDDSQVRHMEVRAHKHTKGGKLLVELRDLQR